MKKDEVFKIIKIINEGFYNKLIEGVVRDLLNGKIQLKDFTEKSIYSNTVLDLKEKAIDLLYKDLLNGNYDNINNQVKNIDNIFFNFNDLIIDKILENKNYKLLNDILMDNKNLSILQYHLVAKIFHRDILDKETSELIKQIIDTNSNSEQYLKNKYISNLLKDINQETIDWIFREDIKMISNQYFESHFDNNVVFTKDDFKEFVLVKIKPTNDLFYIINPHFSLDILEYLEFTKYEKYEMLKDYPFDSIKRIFNEEELKDYNLEETKEILNLHNYKIDITDFSEKKLKILKEAILDICNTKDKSIKIGMLDKLNKQLNLQIKPENLTTNFVKSKEKNLKDISKEEFEKIEKDVNDKIALKIEEKIREL